MVLPCSALAAVVVHHYLALVVAEVVQEELGSLQTHQAWEAPVVQVVGLWPQRQLAFEAYCP